jgi:hypothetical protein
VVAQLPIPVGTSAVELSAAAEQPGLLLVLCKDGTMQLWQLASGLCCCSIQTDAFAAVRQEKILFVLPACTDGKCCKLPGMWRLVLGECRQPLACQAVDGMRTGRAASAAGMEASVIG